MDTAALKLELMERLLAVSDEDTLQRLIAFFKNEGEEALSDAEYAELDAEHARVLRGEGMSYSVEEAMSIVREAVRK